MTEHAGELLPILNNALIFVLGLLLSLVVWIGRKLDKRLDEINNSISETIRARGEDPEKVFADAAEARESRPINVVAEMRMPEQPAPVVNVTNEIHEREQPAPVINVAAPNVEVTVEANMPEQSDIRILEMPDRQTTSDVVRDANGNIVKTTQTEKDA